MSNTIRRCVTLAACACLFLVADTTGAQDKTPPLYADVFGMTVQQLTPQAAQLLGLTGGVQVVAVEPDSEADRAGIVRNDLIVQVNGAKVATTASLFDGLERSGATLNLRIRGASGAKRLRIPRPLVGGRIVFGSQRTGKGDIYVINADGTGLKRLTSGPETEANPVWSPDGSRIAFNGAAPGVHYNLEAWVMNRDGTAARRLSRNPYAKALPRWAPDGKSLYVVSDQSGKWDLVRLPLDGSKPETLAECSPRPDAMAWTYPALDVSPDGGLVAFPRPGDGGFELAMLHTPSGTILPFSARIPRPLRPDWNRAGNKMIVVSDNRFYTVDMKSSQVTPLNLARFDPANLMSITWSPKGDFFIVTARPAPGEALQLYLVSTDGSLRRRLTFGTKDDSMADWTDATSVRPAAPIGQTARK